MTNLSKCIHLYAPEQSGLFELLTATHGIATTTCHCHVSHVCFLPTVPGDLEEECKKLNCVYGCKESGVNTYVCFCKSGYNLATDLKTCDGDYYVLSGSKYLEIIQHLGSFLTIRFHVLKSHQETRNILHHQNYFGDDNTILSHRTFTLQS